MNKLDEIVSSPLKPKEKLVKLSRALLEDKTLIPSVIERYVSAKDSDKGMWMETLELVSEQEPKMIMPQLEFVISQINHKAPRVRWESARLIANIAKDYPDKAAEAIPALLKNTADPGTVVRWSAARARVSGSGVWPRSPRCRRRNSRQTASRTGTWKRQGTSSG